jgi:hypothetical protein
VVVDATNSASPLGGEAREGERLTFITPPPVVLLIPANRDVVDQDIIAAEKVVVDATSSASPRRGEAREGERLTFIAPSPVVLLIPAGRDVEGQDIIAAARVVVAAASSASPRRGEAREGEHLTFIAPFPVVLGCHRLILSFADSLVVPPGKIHCASIRVFRQECGPLSGPESGQAEKSPGVSASNVKSQARNTAVLSTSNASSITSRLPHARMLSPASDNNSRSDTPETTVAQVISPHQLIGAIPAGVAGQVGFGGFAGTQVHLGRQAREETADHRLMPIPDQSLALGGRGRGQQWRQRLTGQRAAFPEIAGFSDTPTGVGLGDTQPVGQRAAQRAAQLLLAGPARRVD